MKFCFFFYLDLACSQVVEAVDALRQRGLSLLEIRNMKCISNMKYEILKREFSVKMTMWIDTDFSEFLPAACELQPFRTRMLPLFECTHKCYECMHVWMDVYMDVFLCIRMHACTDTDTDTKYV